MSKKTTGKHQQKFGRIGRDVDMSWKTSKLGEIAEITMGQAPPGSSYNSTGNGYPLIAGAGDFGEYYPFPTKYTSSPSKLSSKAQIIMCIRATIGDLNWSDKVYALGRGVAGISPKDEIEIKYLWYWITANKKYFIEKGKGATFLQITKNDLVDAPIPLPPLDIQKKIALVLEKADQLRQQCRRVQEELNQLTQSLFLDMFGDPITNPKGWITKKVDEIKAKTKYSLVGGPFGSNLVSKDYVEAGVPVIRGINMATGIINSLDENFVFVTEEKAESLKQNQAFLNDVIFTQRGTLGQVAWINSKCSIEKFIVSQSQMKLTCDEQQVLAYFVYYAFNIPSMIHMVENSAQVTGIPHTNLGILKNYVIPVPPIELQKNFELSMQKIERVKEQIVDKKNELDNLFNSLLQRAFKGELQFNDKAFEGLLEKTADRAIADAPVRASNNSKAKPKVKQYELFDNTIF